MKKQIIILLLLMGCLSLFAAEISNAPFGKQVISGTIKEPFLDEISGVVASRINPPLLYVHNDSGGENCVYIVQPNGKYMGKLVLANATNRDWEDIAIGSGPEEGKTYLYIAETGDNDAKYQEKRIYRVEEPSLKGRTFPVIDTLKTVETIRFQYSDGRRDAETLLFDPLTKNLLIVSKRESNVGMYRLSYPQSTTELMTAQKVATLPFTMIVGGDISPDGKELLLKSYSNIYYWQRKDCPTMAQCMAQPHFLLPYEPEPQGESVCWDSTGNSLYTISEKNGKGPVRIYHYPRLNNKSK